MKCVANAVIEISAFSNFNNSSILKDAKIMHIQWTAGKVFGPKPM